MPYRFDLIRNLLYFSFACLHVWFAMRMPLAALPSAIFDDALFVRISSDILNGRWLGDYDQLTLAKGPFYPVFIAVAAIIGIPILAAQAVLHAAASWLLVRGIRPWLGTERAALILFVLVLANPMAFEANQMRVIREGLYTPLTVLIFALVVWLVRARHGVWRHAFSWAAGLGITLAGFWVTREEGIWIMPALIAIFGFTLLSDAMSHHWRLRCIRSFTVAGITLATAVAGVGAFQFANYLRYGVADIVEFKQREFVSAYASLTRILPSYPVARHVVATPDMLAQAFDVSPAAAELREAMASPAFTNFLVHGCEVYGVDPCDGAARAAWFMWALREAAAASGVHRTALGARDFYGRLAAEIDAACDNGRILCAAPRQSMMPPFDIGLVPQKLVRTMDALWMLATLRGIAPPTEAISCYAENCATNHVTARFLSAVNSSLFQPQQAVVFGGFLRNNTDFITRDIRIFHAARVPLKWIIDLYRWTLAGLLVLALPSLVIAIWLAWWRRAGDTLLAVAIVSAIIVVTRALLIAWLDVVAMPGVITLYLWPAQPPLAVFAFTAVMAAWRLSRKASSSITT